MGEKNWFGHLKNICLAPLEPNERIKNAISHLKGVISYPSSGDQDLLGDQGVMSNLGEV